MQNRQQGPGSLPKSPALSAWRIKCSWQGEEDELVSIVHRDLLVCCRVIWALLSMEVSRLGVEAAERYIEGRATREEFAYAFGVAVGTDLMRSDFRVAIFKIKKVNRVSDSASAGMTQT
jgi:hypothetical protein